MHGSEEMPQQQPQAPEVPEEKQAASAEGETKYVAPDGTVWNSREDYLAYVQGQK